MNDRSVGVLLAAGLGTRYDATGQTLKLLQPVHTSRYGDTPMVIAAARNLRAAVEGVLAVVRPRFHAHQHELHALLLREGCELVVCERANAGMGASLSCAIHASRDTDSWIVALGDMHAIDPSIVESVAQALSEGHVTVAPAFQNRRGHPVGFSALCLDDLLACDGDQGASRVLEKYPPHLVPANDEGILTDVDTR